MPTFHSPCRAAVLMLLLPLAGCSLFGSDGDDTSAFVLERVYRSPTGLLEWGPFGGYNPSNYRAVIEDMPADDPRNRLMIVPLDGSGQARQIGSPGDYGYAQVSPDGRFVFAGVQQPLPWPADALPCPNGLWDVLVHDLHAGTTRIVGRPGMGDVPWHITPDGRHLFARDCSLVDTLRGSHVYDLSQAEPEAQQPWGTQAFVWSFLPDGERVLAFDGYDLDVERWTRFVTMSIGDWTQQAVEQMTPNAKYAFSQTFAPNGEALISGEGTVDPSTLLAEPPVVTGEGTFLWNIFGDGSLTRITDQANLVGTVVSPDGRFVLVNETEWSGTFGPETIRQYVYRIGTDERWELPEHLRAMTYTADGRLVLTDYKREIWTARLRPGIAETGVEGE